MAHVILFLIALVIPSLAWGQPAPSHPPAVADRIRLLEAWIESQMAYRGQPGLAMGIVHDQDLVWARAFGFANRERGVPAMPETLFRIASITKTFTATAIMQLRDQGKLQLDDPVARHLPSFAVRPREPGGHPITIRHLLTHVSGLPREADFPYWGTDQFPTREELVKGLPDHEQFFHAETRWKYSNLAVALAGEIVTAVFDPLTLSNPDRIVRLRPQGEHRFRIEGGFWDGGRDGESVVFELGRDGRVARLKLGPNYTTPVR